MGPQKGSKHQTAKLNWNGHWVESSNVLQRVVWEVKSVICISEHEAAASSGSVEDYHNMLETATIDSREYSKQAARAAGIEKC